MENIIIEFFRGDTYSRNFSISGWNKEITKVYFTVKENTENKQYVLQKRYGEGISLLEENNGTITYNITIDSTDTDDLKTGFDYEFDIEIHSPGTTTIPIKKTVITGIFKLKPSATRTCNE